MRSFFQKNFSEGMSKMLSNIGEPRVLFSSQPSATVRSAINAEASRVRHCMSILPNMTGNGI